MSFPYSKLINSIAALKNVDFSDVWSAFERNDAIIAHSFPPATHLNDAAYLKSRENLLAAIEQYKDEIAVSITKLEQTLIAAIPAFMAQNQIIYHNQFATMKYEEELEWHKLQPPTKTNREEFIRACNSRADWRYPAIIYGNKGSDLLMDFTSFDPLYVVEDHPEYFELYKETYNPDQARKFKYYSWQDRHLLPVGVGAIIIYNDFPYRTNEQIKDKLNFFNSLLLPGGTIAFNYNDCSIGKHMEMFENQLMTYNSFKIMADMVDANGLDVLLANTRTDEYLAWMLCEKPGTLPSVKLGASLGMIDRKPELANKTELAEHNTYVKRAIINYNIDSNNKK